MAAHSTRPAAHFRGGISGGDPAKFFETWVSAVERDYPESVKYMVKVAGLDPAEEGIE